MSVSHGRRSGPASRDGMYLLFVFVVLGVGMFLLIKTNRLPGLKELGFQTPANATTQPGKTSPNSIDLTVPPSEWGNPSPYSIDLTPTTPRTSEPLRAPEESKAELRARVKSRVLALQQLGREIQKSLDQVKTVAAEWSQRSADLLGNDEGRKLATQSTWVERFAALQSVADQNPVTAATVTTWSEQLSLLLQPLVLPADDAQEISMPGNALETDLKSLQQIIGDRGRIMRESVAGLNSLLAMATRQTKSGERTLQQALTALNEERERKLVESKAAGRRHADEAARSALEQAEEKKRAAEIASDLAAKRARANMGIRPTIRWDALARMDRLGPVRNDIERYLRPFITPGYAQPRQIRGKALDLVWESEKKPMSLAGLRKIGALCDDDNGMLWLHRAASSSSNDRPTWNETYDYQLTAKAHELLLKHAEDLVADGLLSP